MDTDLLEMKRKLLHNMQKDNIKILNTEETIQVIKEGNKSLARFGDGEFDIITGGKIGFQNYNVKLSEKLVNILSEKQNFCLIGIPDVISEFNNLSEEHEKFWIENMTKYRNEWLKYIHTDMIYCTTEVTRPYIRYKDKSASKKYFEMIKQLWENREVVICEGEQTRFGVGNDLLDSCKNVKRILCPSENAFDKYNQIFKTLDGTQKDALIIIALGPTATVLAYELSKKGHQAIDIGHLDIEYEWFIRKSLMREKISNKYTNEAERGNETSDIKDEKYLQQIESIIK